MKEIEQQPVPRGDWIWGRGSPIKMVVGPDGPVDCPGSPLKIRQQSGLLHYDSLLSLKVSAPVSPRKGFPTSLGPVGNCVFAQVSFFMAIFILPTNVATMLLIEDLAMFTNFCNWLCATAAGCTTTKPWPCTSCATHGFISITTASNMCKRLCP